MESPRRSGLPLGERAEQVGMASALGELRSQMVLLLESNQALHTRLERIEAGLGTWGGFDDHAGWRVPEPREAPLDMRANPGANRKRASLWGRYEVARGRATVDSAPSSAASSDGAVPTERWMAEEEEAADGAAGWLAASPAHGAPSGDAAGPVCEGLEGGLQVDVPPTSTSFDSEPHSLHARFEGDKNSFGKHLSSPPNTAASQPSHPPCHPHTLSARITASTPSPSQRRDYTAIRKPLLGTCPYIADIRMLFSWHLSVRVPR